MEVTIILSKSGSSEWRQAALDSLKPLDGCSLRVLMFDSADGLQSRAASGVHIEQIAVLPGQTAVEAVNALLPSQSGWWCWLAPSVILAPGALAALSAAVAKDEAGEVAAWRGAAHVVTRSGVVLEQICEPDATSMFEKAWPEKNPRIWLYGCFSAFCSAAALNRIGGYPTELDVLAPLAPVGRLRDRTLEDTAFFRCIEDDLHGSRVSDIEQAEWNYLAVLRGRADAAARVIASQRKLDADSVAAQIPIADIVKRDGEDAVSRFLTTKTIWRHAVNRIPAAITARMARPTRQASEPTPKLGVSYSVFDGIELLEYGIRSIRDHVDFVDVSYQEVSWFGKQATPEDLETLQRLKREGLIDQLYCHREFEILERKGDIPAVIARVKVHETAKRQACLDRCVSQGCTHFISLDVDEMFVPSEFARGWERVKREGLDHTAAVEIRYVKLPIYQQVDAVNIQIMPLFTRVARNTRIGQPHYFVPQVDMTKSYDSRGQRCYFFPERELCCHHMEVVRRNLKKKYESSTIAMIDMKQFDKLEATWKNSSAGGKFGYEGAIYGIQAQVPVIEVPNRFGIPLEPFL